jgi:hypothetical protein
MIEVRREFGDYVTREYALWTHDRIPDRPTLSTDIVNDYVVPNYTAGGPLLFVIIDCLRLDQWRVIRPMLAADFDITESLYCSILPTATPYSRNAIFSGSYPEEIARQRPEWWETDEGSLNSFEDDLFRAQLKKLTGRDVPIHYEKVFTDENSEELIGRVRGALKANNVVAVVFNFVDLLTHGRSESAILMEVARDVPALRALTKQWFERSAALRVLREAAARGVTTILTTDHGSIHCERPVTIFARRDATSNLRYKFGMDLRAEVPSAVFALSQ